MRGRWCLFLTMTAGALETTRNYLMKIIYRTLLGALVGAGISFTAGPVLANDNCDNPRFGLFPGEVGMCRAYCSHLDCDNIFDGDPLSSPQASQNACINIAISFMSMVLDLKRWEIDPVDAIVTLDSNHCIAGCIPPCDEGD